MCENEESIRKVEQPSAVNRANSVSWTSARHVWRDRQGGGVERAGSRLFTRRSVRGYCRYDSVN